MTGSETRHTPGSSRPSNRGDQAPWGGAEQPHEAVARLRSAPPLVFAGECDLLRARLARVARGEASVLQAVDGAGSFGGGSADAIRGRLRTLLQMAAILTYAGGAPVIKTGRLAARDPAPSASAVLRGHESSGATLNLIRAFTTGGYADLRQVHQWNRTFVDRSPERHRYAALADEMGRALAFLRACGQDPARLGTVEFFACHEGLPAAYESALTRVDARTGQHYGTAGHFVWVGAGTWAPGGTRGDGLDTLEHFAAIRNPLGVELGPGTTPDDALGLLDRLDPAREPGRMTFLVRMGAAALRDKLPALIEKVTAEDRQVGWICHLAPDHRGTRPDHRGTRRFVDVLAEVTAFFEVHRTLGTHPGGLTVDLAPDAAALLDLAFRVAELCRGARSRGAQPGVAPSVRGDA